IKQNVSERLELGVTHHIADDHLEPGIALVRIDQLLGLGASFNGEDRSAKLLDLGWRKDVPDHGISMRAEVVQVDVWGKHAAIVIHRFGATGRARMPQCWTLSRRCKSLFQR